MASDILHLEAEAEDVGILQVSPALGERGGSPRINIGRSDGVGDGDGGRLWQQHRGWNILPRDISLDFELRVVGVAILDEFVRNKHSLIIDGKLGDYFRRLELGESDNILPCCSCRRTMVEQNILVKDTLIEDWIILASDGFQSRFIYR